MRFEIDALSQKLMQIRYHCPTDKCVAIVEYEPLEKCTSGIECPRCRQEHAMTITDALRNTNMAKHCVVCGCTELFIRKDFPQRLGFIIVVIFGAAAIFFFRISVVIAWAVLAGAILVDVVIYSLIGKVTICYACRAEYRKCNLNPAHEGFDLSTSEKY